MTSALFRLALSTAAHSPTAARAYIRAFDISVPRLRRIALRNLELAWPAMPRDERNDIVDAMYSSLARMMSVFARFPRLDRHNITDLIRYDGLEHYLEAKARGKGVLFATAHLGNWELSAFAHALLSEPMHVVVRPLDNAGINAVVERYRTLSGNKLIGKWGAGRAILRALHANDAVGILIDQNVMANEGVFINFFGTPACTGTAFVKIAARTGASVVPGFALWSDREQRYILRFHPAVDMTGDVPSATARLHGLLESVIREHPEEWLWIHRRWKTRPPGEPSIY